MHFMMWAGSIGGICEFRPIGKGLTFTVSTFRQHYENDAIVHRPVRITPVIKSRVSPLFL